MSYQEKLVSEQDRPLASEKSEIIIRQMLKTDVPTLVRLHMEVFKGYNTSILGTGYLTSLYRILASHAACISIAALEGNRIGGWIGGVSDWLSFEKALTRNSLGGAPVILLSIIRNRPHLLWKALPVLRRVVLSLFQAPKPSKGIPEKVEARREATLLVIGVVPQCRSQGLGQKMMEAFHRRLLIEGFSTCSLNTYANNELANKAFARAGYQLANAHNGTNRYVKSLS